MPPHQQLLLIAAAILKYAFRRTFTFHQMNESIIDEKSVFARPALEYVEDDEAALVAEVSMLVAACETL